MLCKLEELLCKLEKLLSHFIIIGASLYGIMAINSAETPLHAKAIISVLFAIYYQRIEK